MWAGISQSLDLLNGTKCRGMVNPLSLLELGCPHIPAHGLISELQVLGTFDSD